MKFIIILVWALFGFCFNVSADRECEINVQIKNSHDLSAIRDCEVIKGDFVIVEYDDPLIEFVNLKKIKGDLIISKSPNLVRIESPYMEEIEGAFKMNELTSLSLISFPKLRSIKSLEWRVIPILSNVRFSHEISNIENIIISDTSLTGFSGFQTSQLKNLDINNNRFLEVINSNVETINGKLHIASNSNNLKVNLPHLETVNNATLNDILELYLGNLTEVKDSLNIINNGFEELNLDTLEKIGGTFTILKNKHLSTIKMSELTELNGGLMIINNTKIHDINFLQKLAKIDGGVELVGNFKSVNLLSLKLVKGLAKIKSADPGFDCSKHVKEQFNLAIRGGKIECSTISVADFNDDDDSFQSITQKSSGYKVIIHWIFNFVALCFLF